MYELLNAYLAYGTDQILGNDNYLNALFLSFHEGIKSTKFKNSPFYTCLLIQTWIINCDKINQKFIWEHRRCSLLGAPYGRKLTKIILKIIQKNWLILVLILNNFPRSGF